MLSSGLDLKKRKEIVLYLWFIERDCVLWWDLRDVEVCKGLLLGRGLHIFYLTSRYRIRARVLKLQEDRF